MAKKQGLPSILGSTDATLVNAAYKAAMANVPRSLQSVYDTIGRSFEKGMSALGDGLGEVAKAAGTIGAALIEKQKEEDEDTGVTKSYENDTDFTSPEDPTTDPDEKTPSTFEFGPKAIPNNSSAPFVLSLELAAAQFPEEFI